MADSIVLRLIAEARKRAIGGILNHCENSAWWERLSQKEQRELREKVLASFGNFYDLVRDVVKVGAEEATVNEYTMRLIEQIHAAVKD
jgi:hypothetical protein